jgi:hypothetical protein
MHGHHLIGGHQLTLAHIFKKIKIQKGENLVFSGFFSHQIWKKKNS